jgi:hypothetical protein
MQRADRLERLLADRPGECCEADIEERRETLARRAAAAERVVSSPSVARPAIGWSTSSPPPTANCASANSKWSST